MANTVFTPEALERSVARGAFKKATMADYMTIDADEVFVFRFPARGLLDSENGDGEFLEVWDAAADRSSVTTSRGEITTTPETAIYYR